MYASSRHNPFLRSWLSAAGLVLALGCDADAPAAGADDDGRGGIGKADLFGTCEPADCGGPSSSGNCWCDEHCESFGDCCSNVDQCGGDETSGGESETTGGDTTGGDTTGGDTHGEPDAGQCRTGADCANDGGLGGGLLFCFDADDPVCGTCFDPGSDACDNGNPCAAGQVCEDVFITCGCAGPFAQVCADPCGDDADCGDDRMCDPQTNACVWRRCEADGCGPLHTCEGSAPGTGCVRNTCTEDAECGGAICVNGECHDTFGTCSPAPP